MKQDMKNKKTTTHDPQAIEPYWQSIWQSKRIYQPDLDTANNPFYNLMMFPYPSAEGLHVGNMYAQTGADIYGRFKRMQGFDVFEPIGLDGFGIHSENYALKVGVHPMDQAEKSEENFYRQMRSTGSSFAWENKVETWKPEYYRWTQWIFIQLFKAGLAYRQKSPVNFCPSCKTVLADEQVIPKTESKEGSEEITIRVCERCGTQVEKKELEQWFFRITAYAERLLEGLQRIDWTEKVKVAQRSWIGKSEGARVRFELENKELQTNYIEVFTTRPDTLYGATFLVISPEHPLVNELIKKASLTDKAAIEEYILSAKKKTEQDRVAEGKEKTGVFAQIYAVSPATKQKIPIWIADYVLMSYGTGAIMAVPAHDQRDFEFAKKYNLPIVEVVSGGDTTSKAYQGGGIVINSGEWNGLKVPESIPQIVEDIERKGFGKKEVHYHLRDWIISRQRYWGPPIPMIYCEKCAREGKSWFTTSAYSQYLEHLSSRNSKILKIQNPKSSESPQMAGWYPEENLPVLLPRIEDYKPLGTQAAPLANHPEFYETVCPECGSQARRETDVSDTFLDSSWYFLRYLATDLEHLPFPSLAFEREEIMTDLHPARTREEIVSLEEEVSKAKKRVRWLPVTLYTGGAEHAVLHLLYTRFLYKVLYDLEYVTGGDEPFPRFFAHGLIIKDGAKMSKSKGNVVVPDQYIKKFGADTLRTYLMFIGPFSQGGDFRDSGIEGVHRFLKRVWKLVVSQIEQQTERSDNEDANWNQADISQMHKTIKEVTEDIEKFHYNTAIAKIMTYYNFLSRKKGHIMKQELEVLLKLLAPFAPHLTEELYQRLNMQKRVSASRKDNAQRANTLDSQLLESIHTSSWPKFDPSAIKEEEVVIAVQVNGKLRGTLSIPSDKKITEEEIIDLAKKQESIKRHLNGKTIQKTIYIPGKIINFVTR